MSQYFLESTGQGVSKKYRLISVGCLWAEQFSFEIDWFFENLKSTKMEKLEIHEIFSIALTAAIFIVDGSFFAYNLGLYVCFRVFHFFGQKMGVSAISTSHALEI